MARIISLGEYLIRFGARNDANRIKTMVGGFNHSMGGDGLDPGRFAVNKQIDHPQWRRRAGIDGWPEGEQRFELFAVDFNSEFRDYGAMLEAASRDSTLAELQRGGFPHLQPFLSEKKAEWLHSQHGILWLQATDENSLWFFHQGNLHTLYLDCSPDKRRLCVLDVYWRRSASVWYLFTRES